MTDSQHTELSENTVKAPSCIHKTFAFFLFAALAAAGSALSPFPARAELPHGSVDVLESSMDDVLANELENLEAIKDRLREAETAQKKIMGEINAYKLKLPVYNNLLLSSKTVSVEDLEKAWLETRALGEEISRKVEGFNGERSGLTPLLGQTRDQVAMTEKQMVEILSDITLKKETASVTKRYKKFAGALKEKYDRLESLDGLYAGRITALKEVQQGFSDISNKLNETIIRKKKESLLERRDFWMNIGFKRILDDSRPVLQQLKAAATVEYWKGEAKAFKTGGAIFMVSFVLLFAIVLFLSRRCRGWLFRLESHPALRDRGWNRLVLKVLHQSMLLLGMTLFIYGYSQAGPVQSKSPVMSVIFHVLLIWLMTGWCLDVLNTTDTGDLIRLPHAATAYLMRFVRMVRWFSVICALLMGFGGGGGAVLIVWRVVFTAGLYVWNLMFWKTVWRLPQFESASKRKQAVFTSVKSVSFAVVLAAFVLELAGYGMLAQYWLTSWGGSLVAGLWAALVFFAIREWDPKSGRAPEEKLDAAAPKTSVRWVMVQLSLAAWFSAFVISLVFAWGGKQAVFVGIFRFLEHTFSLGSLRFSLLGIIVAVLTLLLTHAVSRIWQHVFRKKILKQSGMDEGVQDSVVTISVYVIWSVGILFSLNAVGFTATSLTVVMGALGVGLGFGLQTIFNNFISGIILLFERPIQVGDDIEVGGVWARVREINVRSTIVQTYDNASLIIPNADLISSQVVNWSFRDKRIRRNVEVGVAYGSDVMLVRDTLLEVAETTPRILKLPKPDVIFKNFGDSALIFLLRFWTRLEYFYAVESEVRFEIDRLFRERHIEMAFPQLDIHVRTGMTPPSGKGGDMHPSLTIND